MWLTNANVVEVTTGDIAHQHDLQLLDDRITQVVPSDQRAWEGTSEQVVDVHGQYLLPGFISLHVHLSVVYPFSAMDEDENPGLTTARPWCAPRPRCRPASPPCGAWRS